MRSPAEFDTDVRLQVYRAFVATGEAPTAAEVAAALGAPADSVEAALERLDAIRAVVLSPEDRAIWLANPFSATPTGFEVETADRSYHAACGWDSLGIVALLRRPGTVVYSCPDCGKQTRLAVMPDGPGSSETVVYFGTPAASWWDDLGST